MVIFKNIWINSNFYKKINGNNNLIILKYKKNSKCFLWFRFQKFELDTNIDINIDKTLTFENV